MGDAGKIFCNVVPCHEDMVYIPDFQSIRIFTDFFIVIHGQKGAYPILVLQQGKMEFPGCLVLPSTDAAKVIDMSGKLWHDAGATSKVMFQNLVSAASFPESASVGCGT